MPHFTKQVNSSYAILPGAGSMELQMEALADKASDIVDG